jgi:chromosome segregation ATPase
MAGHLNKAMELQEAALEAATAATLERDEITNVAIKLKTELEAAKVQLQDAAAAAAAVRYRITSSTASSVHVSELLNASLAAEEEEQGRSDDSQSCSTTSFTDETQINVQNAISEALEEVQAARCDAMEAQIEAQQEREVADLLRERCATLESQLQNLQNDIEMVENGGSSSDAEAALRLELEQKKQECHDLAAAGAQADVAMRNCLEQLRALTIELQHTREAAVSARTELHDREMQLKSLQNAVQVLDSERIALHEQLVITQAALQQQNEGFTTSFEAERQAAANEFDALRSNMQDLARQYQELCSQTAALQRERDAATQFAEASASQAAFYEQETRAKESALGHAEASYAVLVENNRRLQEAVMSLQQEVAAQACRARFSSDCAHAALQRRAATAEGSTALVEVRLSDAMAEVSMLRQQLTVQATKSEELEALLLEERRKQFREEENVNIVNVINLQDSEEPRSEIMKGAVDAVDEVMMQRLDELEIECVQLREELQRVQSGTGLEAVPKEEEDPPRPPEPVIGPQRNVLEQLATIAEGLKDLGSK